jgi:hypothetical protein
MGAKLIVALAAVGIAVLIICCLLMGSLFYNYIVSEAEQATTQLTPQNTPQNIQNVIQANMTNQGIINTAGLTAIDDRTMVPYSLYISGVINNTGSSTVYNLYLHVIAFNKEGQAIDDFHSIGGMIAHSSLGLGFSLQYTGSPLESCLITPICTDELGLPPANSTAS